MPVTGRTATGRYPRGEETKRRIIDIAIEMFSQHGYRGASTRDIATAAGVNTPAIQYYFDGKPGLYHASVVQTVDTIWSRIGPAIALCEQSLEQNMPPRKVIRSLGDVQDCMVDSFFADDEGKRIWRLLAWNDIDDDTEAVGTLMRDRIGFPIFRIFESVVARLSMDSMSNTELEMTSFLLMGSSMIFHMDKGRMVQNMPWHAPDREELILLKTIVRRNLNSSLSALRKSK